MKKINILSLIQARETLDSDDLTSYVKFYGIDIKPAELQDLKNFIELLSDEVDDLTKFSGFYIGYKISQIGKEFDLLRFGQSSILNIELKSTSDEDRIKKQLIRNKYYLNFLNRDIHAFTYETASNKLYHLNENDMLVEVDAAFFLNLLNNQKLEYRDDVDSFFNPSDYLVSPFNSTDKFLSNQYFLTLQQEDVKKTILKSLESTNSATFISIVGGAGTGKTLLTYDIAKQLMVKGKETLIIHCGNLNDGQNKLNAMKWNIIPIKGFSKINLENYDVIMIDEVQRIYPQQLDKIIKIINKNNMACIFSYDKSQTLSKKEARDDIDSKINSVNLIKTYKLSEKIRTNKEIANFIRMLFDRKRSFEKSKHNNIEINYFADHESAKRYFESLDGNEWTVLRFTPSQYDNEFHEKYSDVNAEVSHAVIGQEFDNVAIAIDPYFSYNDDGKLDYTGRAYYYPLKMLFQNITRARKKINLVIINNEEILKRCISVLN
ncbi:ATP-binding protein [Morganella morganii]|uniref:ATP-binding protein n=1 Tax=Morganella morganii TaxID=582 RepID=UPI0021CE03AE|nr:ATP-binding protein [Morganella morganii]MCU6236736.1 ATP-binding protein [Morganella morganii]